MLVIRRRAGEVIVIGGEVEIEVVEISPTRVKLGVSAPREVTVARKETLVVAEENRKAAGLMGQADVGAMLRLVGGGLEAAGGPREPAKASGATADKE